jgi:hypothetical protein
MANMAFSERPSIRAVTAGATIDVTAISTPTVTRPATTVIDSTTSSAESISPTRILKFAGT